MSTIPTGATAVHLKPQRAARGVIQYARGAGARDPEARVDGPEVRTDEHRGRRDVEARVREGGAPGGAPALQARRRSVTTETSACPVPRTL